MSKMTNPFKTWTAVLCVVISAMLHSERAVAGIVTFGSGVNAFDMEFVAIGNANNDDDMTGNPSVAGKVEYAYQMGKFEVSEDMITKFNASQSLTVTKDTRGTNKPATSVSWNEAARFVNWLNTSKGYQAAYNFTTSGVNDNIEFWNVGDGFALGGSSENLFRHKNAHFWLPSMDEWYKAAYYDPTANVGLGGYFNFPNGLDTAPTAVSSGTTANTAVYNQTFAQGPADIMSAGGLSPYGIMGLGGNVFEWEETAFDLTNIDSSIRGGDWLNGSRVLSSRSRLPLNPASENGNIGFRVASLSSDAVAVPEPSSLIMFSTMALSLLWYRKRLRK